MGKRDKDSELWARVAKTARPLKGRKRAAASPSPGEPEPVQPPPSAEQHSSEMPAPQPVKVRPKPRPPAVPAPLDRQTSRHLETGRLAVEARLDLHGMRQRDAHAALRRFLKTAQAKGKRHVLVITGKGAPQSESKSFYEEEERGVLRNAVPLWLAEPNFAPLVVSFSEAPRRLGGAGALYVRLRKGRS
jgi:DNA-nicking Smr family endonuclease